MYINEVTNSKGLTVGIALNWFLLILTGLGTPHLFAHKTLAPYTFIIFGGINTFCTLMVWLFMKETRNVPEHLIKKLYLRNDKT